MNAATALRPASPPMPTAITDLFPRLAEHLRGLPLRRRTVHAREVLFHAGQRTGTLYLVHAGFFKTVVVSPDGREKITGFRLRGDLLGVDSIGLPVHACQAVALDMGEVWELPLDELQRHLPEFLPELASLMAGEIRRDWKWMLDMGSLNAEQRVIAFLLDLGARFQGLGFSRYDLRLRMTRADLGNFLSLQLETVTRALSKLAASGLIVVEGREIRLQDPAALERRIALAA
jgi:CRP/FNR family transcriptional regulator